MKNFFKELADVVFSFGTFITLVILGFLFLMFRLGDLDRHQNQFCYAKNMVVVHTDAGSRCAIPSLLIEIK